MNYSFIPTHPILPNFWEWLFSRIQLCFVAQRQPSYRDSHLYVACWSIFAVSLISLDFCHSESPWFLHWSYFDHDHKCFQRRHVTTRRSLTLTWDLPHSSPHNQCSTIKSPPFPSPPPSCIHMVQFIPPPPTPPPTLAQQRCFWTKQNTDHQISPIWSWSLRVTWHIVNELLMFSFPVITLGQLTFANSACTMTQPPL